MTKPATDDLLECDIIMRGGATSGVIYPGALVELAKSYRFRNIGGASAGAIAAGVAAAAEYGRRNGKQDVFEQEIAPISQELGQIDSVSGESRLKQLFMPQPSLKTGSGIAFDLLETGGDSKGIERVAIAKLKPALMPLLVAALLVGLATTVAMAIIGDRFDIWASTAIGATFAVLVPLVAGLFTGLVAAIVGLVLAGRQLVGDVKSFVGAFEAGGFGLCSGVNAAIQGSDATEDYRNQGALSDWLHAAIQSAAGRGIADAPLCMSDLWGHDDPLAPNRQIDLTLTTTNLSQQLPHQFPFIERPQSSLYFCPEDLAKVVPAHVVAYMVGLHERAATDQVTDDRSDRRRRYHGNYRLERDGRIFLRLPKPQDLPVLLGVRLSLSFPGLISAVKLYETKSWRAGQDEISAAAARQRATDALRPCWFSDGGLTSNFPVTTFDAPLPSRPTFCIGLANLSDDDLKRPNLAEAKRVRMADANADDINARHLADLDRGGVVAFLGSLFSTARSGHENELLTTPGQRDRIVTIDLDPAKEGGLNLTMPPETIATLAGYGTRAGQMLFNRFHPSGDRTGNQTMDWDNHRWVRLRTSLAAIESLMVRVSTSWSSKHFDGGSYPAILSASIAEKPPSYVWGSQDRAELAASVANKIAEFATELTAVDPARPGSTIFNGYRPYDVHPTANFRVDAAPQPWMALQSRPSGNDPLKG